MMYRTHLASGLAIAGFSGLVANLDLAFIAGSLLGSLLPDLDHPKSRLGRLVLPVSLALYGVFGHRGGTHSLLFAVLCLLITIISPAFGLGLVAGVLIHILADMISYSSGTPFQKGGGCPVFYPSDKRIGFRLIKVDGFAENFIVFPAFCFLSFLFFLLQ